MTETEFYESVDRSIAQADHGELQDAFEAFDEITSELEAGYSAMLEVRERNQQRRAVAL